MKNHDFLNVKHLRWKFSTFEDRKINFGSINIDTFRTQGVEELIFCFEQNAKKTFLDLLSVLLFVFLS